MQKSLELCTDRATCGAAYALLAFQTSSRSGMWNRGVGRGRRGSAGSSGHSSSRRRRAQRARRPSPPEPSYARRAATKLPARPSALADRLGDAEAAFLRVGGRGGGRLRAAALRRGLCAGEPALRLPPRDQRSRPHPRHLRGGDSALAGAGRPGRGPHAWPARMSSSSRTLTPHHRIHGVGLTLEVRGARGRLGGDPQLER